VGKLQAHVNKPDRFAPSNLRQGKGKNPENREAAWHVPYQVGTVDRGREGWGEVISMARNEG